MSDRITIKQLENLADRINNAAGTPSEPWTLVDGKYVAQAFNYHITGAYGGHCLEQMAESGSGSRDALSTGFTTKRDLYQRMQAFLLGITR